MNGLVNYIIRPVKENEKDIVYNIKKNALGKYIEQTWGWDEDFQKKMQIEEFKTENISIIESDGIPVGTIGINEKENDVIISRLYIIDKYQSKGIGIGIMRDIIEKYSSSGKQIKLGVLFVNKRAKFLYEKLGFEVYGEENEHFKMVYRNNKHEL